MGSLLRSFYLKKEPEFRELPLSLCELPYRPSLRGCSCGGGFEAGHGFEQLEAQRPRRKAIQKRTSELRASQLQSSCIGTVSVLPDTPIFGIQVKRHLTRPPGENQVYNRCSESLPYTAFEELSLCSIRAARPPLSAESEKIHAATGNMRASAIITDNQKRSTPLKTTKP